MVWCPTILYFSFLWSLYHEKRTLSFYVFSCFYFTEIKSIRRRGKTNISYKIVKSSALPLHIAECFIFHIQFSVLLFMPRYVWFGYAWFWASVGGVDFLVWFLLSNSLATWPDRKALWTDHIICVRRAITGNSLGNFCLVTSSQAITWWTLSVGRRQLLCECPMTAQ